MEPKLVMNNEDAISEIKDIISKLEDIQIAIESNKPLDSTQRAFITMHNIL